MQIQPLVSYLEPYPGWNIHFLPAGHSEQAVICRDTHGACGEQACKKLFRHFLFFSTLKILLAAQCMHTRLHLCLYADWLKRKSRYLHVETQVGNQCRRCGLKSMEVLVWSGTAINSPQVTKQLYISGNPQASCLAFIPHAL